MLVKETHYDLDFLSDRHTKPVDSSQIEMAFTYIYDFNVTLKNLIYI